MYFYNIENEFHINDGEVGICMKQNGDCIDTLCLTIPKNQNMNST